MPRGPVRHDLLVKPAHPDGTATLPATEPQSKAGTGDKPETTHCLHPLTSSHLGPWRSFALSLLSLDMSSLYFVLLLSQQQHNKKIPHQRKGRYQRNVYGERHRGICCYFYWNVTHLIAGLSCLHQEQRSLGHQLVVMSNWAQKVSRYLVDGVLILSIAEPELWTVFQSPYIFLWYVLQWVNQLLSPVCVCLCHSSLNRGLRDGTKCAIVTPAVVFLQTEVACVLCNVVEQKSAQTNDEPMCHSRTFLSRSLSSLTLLDLNPSPCR